MGLEFWRNLAIVWLSLLCFIGMLIPLAAAIFAVKGMHVVVAKTPGLLRQAQAGTRRARLETDNISRSTAEQVIRVRSRIERYQTRLMRLAGASSSRPQGRRSTL